ncbi:hypothetical protein BS47DRAFT_671165 [Hydnum rufescens UP504]|uniref:Uncharacterized protein n=1 Tax=Hydnum rufescens UP504 TaxID=1448309 RepID=A0A9P6AEK1_9AGAM|nr:hypothetical protein BS47DRAFT_671165 [Hydnum rufescens UP504]
MIPTHLKHRRNMACNYCTNSSSNSNQCLLAPWIKDVIHPTMPTHLSTGETRPVIAHFHFYSFGGTPQGCWREDRMPKSILMLTVYLLLIAGSS